MATLRNLFSDLKPRSDDEQASVLLESAAVRIERIVSYGHASPPGFWYDQERSEWVVVLQGAARIRFEERDVLVEMGPGDMLEIPAHARHRVDWTTPDEPTVWLAVFHS